jgi:hypothetical protein
MKAGLHDFDLPRFRPSARGATPGDSNAAGEIRPRPISGCGRGKIARLPGDLREELCRRLFDGQRGPEILPWLNAHPVAVSVLAKDFGGRPVNAANLTNWRRGGYIQWLCVRRLVSEISAPVARGLGPAPAEGSAAGRGFF